MLSSKWSRPRKRSATRERRFVMTQFEKSQQPASFIARMAEMLAATDRFVTWWGAHRAWPANEQPRVGRCR